MMLVERLANDLIELTQAWIPALPLTRTVAMDLPLAIISMAPLSCDVTSVPLSNYLPGASPTSIFQSHPQGFSFCLSIPSGTWLRTICWLPGSDLYHARQRKTLIISWPHSSVLLCQISIDVKPLLLDSALWKHFTFQSSWTSELSPRDCGPVLFPLLYGQETEAQRG